MMSENYLVRNQIQKISKLIFIIFINGALSQQYTTIDTPLGSITGSIQNGFRSFKGIPFAVRKKLKYHDKRTIKESPTGELRWEPPIPKSSWGSNSLDATKFGMCCVQTMLNSNTYPQSEDCLFLNVYTPIPEVNSSTLLPVMVRSSGSEVFLR